MWNNETDSSHSKHSADDMFDESAEKRFLDLFNYSSDADTKKRNYISFLKKNKARNREHTDGVNGDLF